MKLRRRTVVVLTAVLVGVLVAMWVVDTAIAARSERLLSQRVAEHSHLGFAPEAYFGGLPFVSNFITGVVPSMYVSVTDVKVKPFGLLRTHTTITDVEVSADRLLAGDVAGAKAALITRGVNLMRCLWVARWGLPIWIFRIRMIFRRRGVRRQR